MSTLTQRAAVVLAFASIAATAGAQRPTTKLPARPTPGPAKTFVYPAVALDSLPNGLRFAVVEKHELPIVIVRSVLTGTGPLGASFLDPAGKEGAWGVLLTALREGTTTRSATQLNDEVTDLGTEFVTSGPAAFLPPFFRAAKSTWEPSLHLLSDILINPAVTADGVSRAKTLATSALDRLPSLSIANRMLYNVHYGQESAYNHFAVSASVKTLTLEDVLAMKRDYLGPQNTIIVITGDVTRAEAKRAMQEAFGKWERSRVTVSPVVPAGPASAAPTTIYLKDRPGSATSTIVAGPVVPGRDNANAASVDAMVAVLGDGSSSRVYRAFRTERGLSYVSGVQVLTPRPIPETAIVSAVLPVATAATDSGVMAWLEIVRDIRGQKPVLASELESAQDNLVGQLPKKLEKLDDLSINVTNAIRDRLPPGYLNDWIKRIGGLTVADVQAAVNRYMDPEHMPIVVVGDRAKIEAALRATGIPVVIVP